MTVQEQYPQTVETLDDLAQFADYSFMESLNIDPQSSEDGIDHSPSLNTP